MARPLRSLSAAAFVTALLLLSVCAPARAAMAGDDASIGLVLGELTGDTRYHISSYDATGGVESELEFPLRTLLLGIDGAYAGKDDQGRSRFRIGLQALLNADNGSGQLKDSDWLSDQADITTVGSVHPGLDIYSLSDISSKAWLINLRGSFNAWLSDRVAVGPLAGFQYERFRFDASDLTQVGFGPYAAGYTGAVPGPVLTYDATYAVPYAGLCAEFALSSGLRASADLRYSPLASASDKDNHLLRGKTAEATATGSAYGAEFSAAWDLGTGDSISLTGSYLRIDTSGTQTQTWYRNDGSIPAGTTIAGIVDKITSEQTFLSIRFAHRF